MSNNVQKYIPQAPPMVMVDTFVEGTKTATTAQLLVKADNILVEGDHFSESGLVEHMAQTVALHAGISKQEGEAPKVGYIGALKDLEIFSLPKVGSLLQTTITVTHQIMGATVIQGVTKCNGEIIATCEMKIFIQDKA